MSAKDISVLIKFESPSGQRVVSREGVSLEFKEAFNWNSKARYAKSMAAFANHKGGYLVLGVSNNPRLLKGLAGDGFEDLDEARITEYLNSLFMPAIDFEKYVENIRGQKIGVIYIKESSNKPVVSIRADDAVNASEIYFRYNARSERIRYPELKNMLNRIKEEERKNWMDHIERIARIGPAEAAILDTVEGKIEGSRANLLIDRKLLPKLKFIAEGKFAEKGSAVLKLIGDVKPVTLSAGRSTQSKRFRVTTDPTAPEIRLSEEDLIFQYPLGYSQLTDKLRATFKGFKSDDKYHALRKRLKSDPNYCRTRLLDPNNPRSQKKDFYSRSMVDELGKHYSSKNESDKK